MQAAARSLENGESAKRREECQRFRVSFGKYGEKFRLARSKVMHGRLSSSEGGRLVNFRA